MAEHEFQMTTQTLQVLSVLLDDPQAEHYGLQISKRAELPTGSVYPILARLEQHGWVESAWERIDPVAEGRRPRRYYRLTPSGAERAQNARAEAMRLIAPRGRPVTGGPGPAGRRHELVPEGPGRCGYGRIGTAAPG